MSNAAGDGGGSTVEMEFDSIQTAVKQVKDISNTIGTLEASFSSFAQGVQPSDWSTQSACVKFGESYKAAVTVYADVIAGMKLDLARYSAALQSAWDEYKKSDDNSAAALAKLGAVDDGGLSQNTNGRHTYDDPKNHGSLSSDDPTQATDTTPNDSRATQMPGSSTTTSGNNGQNAGSQNGGAGQSTQPTGSGVVAR